MVEYLSKDLSHLQVLQRDISTNTATVVLKTGDKVDYKTGGPYGIEGKKDIYVGDVWVMAGQSNMRGHGFFNAAFQKENPDQTLEHVHLFDSTEKWRVNSDPTHALHLSKRAVHHTLPDPTVRNPEICKYRGASLGPSFGANYEKGVPLGLISSAHGGVSLKDWERPAKLDANTCNTTLYGAMIDRIRKVGGTIAGVLWYQGESDTLSAEDADTYKIRFQNWLRLLRTDLSPNLPLVLIQLGPHRVDAPAMVKNWMTVQDQQMQLIGIDSYLSGVSSIDCSLDDRLHLSKDGLDILGKRSAAAAILALRGQGKRATPLPKSAVYQKITCIPGQLEVHTIKIEFELPENFEFNCGAADVFGFEIQNQSSVLILRARIEDDQKSIRLYITGDLSKIPQQTLISYGMNTAVNLNQGEDCILPAFKDLKVVCDEQMYA